jgi:hypothetical protein
VSPSIKQFSESSNCKWLTMAGVGIVATLCGVWLSRRPGRRSDSDGGVGKHAWLVPTQQSREEGKWTNQALIHSSESH